mgnify:CR=1 FL=1
MIPDSVAVLGIVATTAVLLFQLRPTDVEGDQ